MMKSVLIQVILISSVTAFTFHVQRNTHHGLVGGGSTSKICQRKIPCLLQSSLSEEDEYVLNMDPINPLYEKNTHDSSTPPSTQPNQRARIMKLRKHLTLAVVALYSGYSGKILPFLPSQSAQSPPPAHAAVMLPYRHKEENPQDSDTMGYNHALQQAQQRERAEERLVQSNFRAESDRILESEGAEARDKFEKAWHAERKAEYAAKIEEKKEIYASLLREGIDPNGPVGKGILFKWEHGVDLAEIMDTEQFNLEQLRDMAPDQYEELMEQMKKKTFADVEALNKENVDLYQYYTKLGRIMFSHPAITNADKASPLERKDFLEKKAALLESLRGTANTAGGGGKVKAATVDKGAAAAAKAQAKAEKKAAKEAAKAEAARVKAEKKDAKLKAQLDEQAEKDRIAQEKVAAKEAEKVKKSSVEAAKAAADAATKASAAVAAGAFATGTATSSLEGVATAASGAAESSAVEQGAPSASAEGVVQESAETSAATAATTAGKASILATKNGKIAIGSAAAATAGGAGFFMLNISKKKAEAEEKERERQFSLIMGRALDEDGVGDNDVVGGFEEVNNSLTIDDDISSLMLDDTAAPAASPATEVTEAAAAPAKRKRGMLGSMFSKKDEDGRDSNLDNVLSVTVNPTTAEYGQVLSQYLTIGAPGRFPQLESSLSARNDELKSVTNDAGEFQIDTARENLVSFKNKVGLTDEVAAETFANVVHCMILDLIDLANSATKAKRKEEESAVQKRTVDALNVVLDFMDHAASLFDAVAENVTINPVTYGGTLGKKQLEAMYSAYATTSMLSMDEKASDRLETLQQVFSIRDKKAEGIQQKVMMKNLMKMMKEGENGEGMEGMAEMMAAMGGGDEKGMADMLSGLGGAGMGEDGEDISPEELKQSVEMMKQLIDSGSISKEELDLVRKQFKDTYGADISELVKAADGADVGDDLGEDGKELLELFKTVLGDDDK